MLTATKINSLRPKEKPYKVADANGLYIDVRPSGSKFWRQKYRYNGKEKLLSHGKYPLITLAEARQLRDKAIKHLKDKIDPAKIKKRDESKRNNTFGVIAKEWHEKQSINWKPIHAQKVWHQFEVDIFPYLKNEPIDNISPTELLEVIKKVEKRGALDIASRLRQRCEGVFKHAILTERATHNPATQLVGVLKTKKTTHRNALDRKELPEFLEKLEHFDTHPIIKLATNFLIHTFVRTGELRFAVWDEIDFSRQIWLIPGNRMKMNLDHIVPLTDQSMSVLKRLKPFTGHRTFIFTSPQRPKQPISENAILNLIYRMGYKGKATGHGFRSTASTLLNEMGYNPDAIERQLAHTDTNKIRAAYNRSEYIEERIKLMKGWSNYIDAQTNKVIPIRNIN